MGKKAVLGLTIVLILGLALRLIGASQSFWLDEAAQALMSSRSISEIWFNRGSDFHPPFFYILSHLWLNIGHSELFLRILPLFFGLLNIYVLHQMAIELYPNQKIKFKALSISTGLLAAFFLAISPFHIYYSQEFRPYSLLCLLGTLSMYLLFKKKFIGLSLINTLLIYTHYSSVFLFIAQFAIIVFNSKELAKKLLLSFLFTFILFLAWMPQFLNQINSTAATEARSTVWKSMLSISAAKAPAVTIFKLIAGRINILSNTFYSIYYVYIFIIFAAIVLFSKSHKSFLCLWIFIPIISIIVTSIFFPQTQPFRLIYILPAIYLLAADVATNAPKRIILSLIYISLFGNIMYLTRPRLQRENWREAVGYINSQNQPVLVRFPGAFAPLTWYSTNTKVISTTDTLVLNPASVTKAVFGQLHQTDILVMDYLFELTDPSRMLDSTLKTAGFTEVSAKNFEGVGIIRSFKKTSLGI